MNNKINTNISYAIGSMFALLHLENFIEYILGHDKKSKYLL